MNRVDGQYSAYEVSRIIESYRGHQHPSVHEPVATLWDEAEAARLSGIVNPYEGGLNDPYNGPTVKKIGVIILDGQAYYDVAAPPVPVELIADDLAQAVSMIAPVTS